MASSFIEFQNNGFWIRDGILEPASSYLYLTIFNHNPKEDWLTEMGEHIKFNSWGYFSGFMNLRLDHYLSNEDRQALFLLLLDKTVSSLAKKDKVLDLAKDAGEHLDEESLSIYVGPGALERDRVIAVLKFIRKVVNKEKVDNGPGSETMMI